MRILSLLLLISAVLVSCSTQKSKSTPTSILDQAFAFYAAELVAAQPDMPGDEWTTSTIPAVRPRNVSRERRESEVTKKMLSLAKRMAGQINTDYLLISLKTVEALERESFSGVRFWLYSEGNQIIVHELTSQPVGDWAHAKEYESDCRHIFAGTNGPAITIAELKQQRSARQNSVGVHVSSPE